MARIPWTCTRPRACISGDAPGLRRRRRRPAAFPIGPPATRPARTRLAPRPDCGSWGGPAAPDRAQVSSVGVATTRSWPKAVSGILDRWSGGSVEDPRNSLAPPGANLLGVRRLEGASQRLVRLRRKAPAEPCLLEGASQRLVCLRRKAPAEPPRAARAGVRGMAAHRRLRVRGGSPSSGPAGCRLARNRLAHRSDGGFRNSPGVGRTTLALPWSADG